MSLKNKLPIDRMTMSYLETAIWSSNYNNEPLDYHGVSISDVDDDFIQQSIKECSEFYSLAYDLLVDGEHDLEQIGHDFWLTRNYHGAGFWDGDYVNGDELTTIAHGFGEVDLIEYIKFAA